MSADDRADCKGVLFVLGVQFSEIRAFQELVGHYDAMTLQGGIGGLVTGATPSEKQATGFKGAQWFKTV